MRSKRLQRMGKGMARRLAVLGVLGALIGALPAAAVTLSLAPSSLSPAVGSAFTLDLVVSGTSAGAAPSLGGFDVAVVFDPAAVTFTGVSYGTLLGALPAQATTATVAGPGAVALAEVSFLPPGDLDALQPDAFTLATLGFVATTLAPSTISLGSVLLSDGFGRPLGVEVPFGSAAVTPTPSSAVPEPGAALVYGVGLWVVSRSRAIRRQAQ